MPDVMVSAPTAHRVDLGSIPSFGHFRIGQFFRKNRMLYNQKVVITHPTTRDIRQLPFGSSRDDGSEQQSNQPRLQVKQPQVPSVGTRGTKRTNLSPPRAPPKLGRG